VGARRSPAATTTTSSSRSSAPIRETRDRRAPGPAGSRRTRWSSPRLEAIAAEHAFGNINLTDNIVQFETARYSANPLYVRGPGAGPEVTAGGVFGDLLRLAKFLNVGA
jgi:hypothetical protein